jgi:hypothetical protein
MSEPTEVGTLRELMRLMREFGCTRLTIADHVSIDMAVDGPAPNPVSLSVEDTRTKPPPPAAPPPREEPETEESAITWETIDGKTVPVLHPDLFGVMG